MKHVVSDQNWPEEERLDETRKLSEKKSEYGNG